MNGLNGLLMQRLQIVTHAGVHYQGRLISYDPSARSLALDEVICFGSEGQSTPPKYVKETIVFSQAGIRTFRPIVDLEDTAIVGRIGHQAGYQQMSTNIPSSRPHNTPAYMHAYNEGQRYAHVDPRALVGGHGRAGQRGNAHKNANRGGNRNQQPKAQEATAGNKKNKKQNQPKSPKKGEKNVHFADEPRQHIPTIPQNARTKTKSGRAKKSGQKHIQGTFPNPDTPLKQFEKDYDFDQANEKFKELSVKENSDKSAQAVYDHVDFFDHLTTSTDNDKQQRQSWREVMLANKETFGVSYVPGRRNFFRRKGPNSPSKHRHAILGRHVSPKALLAM